MVYLGKCVGVERGGRNYAVGLVGTFLMKIALSQRKGDGGSA